MDLRKFLCFSTISAVSLSLTVRPIVTVPPWLGFAITFSLGSLSLFIILIRGSPNFQREFVQVYQISPYDAVPSAHILASPKPAINASVSASTPEVRASDTASAEKSSPDAPCARNAIRSFKLLASFFQLCIFPLKTTSFSASKSTPNPVVVLLPIIDIASSSSEIIPL